MKTLFISLTVSIILFAIFPSLAQTEKGTMLLGGNSNFRIHDDGFNAYINPNIGFFVVDNFALGGSLPLYYSGYEHGSNTNIGFAPFARYYFGEGSTRLFALASLGYRHGWYRYNNGFAEDKDSEGSVMGSAGIGLVYFLTNQIGAEAILAYNANGGNINLGFGFQIFLPSSK